jgi:hypothetical protein
MTCTNSHAALRLIRARFEVDTFSQLARNMTTIFQSIPAPRVLNGFMFNLKPRTSAWRPNGHPRPVKVTYSSALHTLANSRHEIEVPIWCNYSLGYLGAGMQH